MRSINWEETITAVSSALLEVLDPEQNASFYDNYIQSKLRFIKILFIATANSLASIQGPLLDRMELIEVNGYTIEEIKIAKNHFVTRNNLEAARPYEKQLIIDKKTIEKVIENYTNESGVRDWIKSIAKIVRQRAKTNRIRRNVQCETNCR